MLLVDTEVYLVGVPTVLPLLLASFRTKRGGGDPQVGLCALSFVVALMLLQSTSQQLSMTCIESAHVL